MSLRSKNSMSRQRQRLGQGSFSSMSMGSYNFSRASVGAEARAPITAVTVNRSLLAPLNIDIDPTVQAVRSQEKEQIKTLNNRFASFIDKVRFLEQQNKMLETKWDLLQSQTSASSSIEPMLKAYISNLERQLTAVNNDKMRLDMENSAMHQSVEEFKGRYEEEINKRNDAENEFVMLKKDVDSGYLSHTDLGDRVSGEQEEMNFLRALYDMEIKELQDNLKTTSVVVKMDNSRDLNMEKVVADVKAQYEDIAAQSRCEAENWYKSKVAQASAEADQYGDEMRNSKGEISQLHRLISRLQAEILNAKAQVSILEAQITEAEQRGEDAMKDAKSRIRDLELALQRAKHDMARQLREYQELMNIKLALDIEISTYKKLLEGEEQRLGHDSILNIHEVPGLSPTASRKRSSPLLIKTVETHDRLFERSNEH